MNRPIVLHDAEAGADAAPGPQCIPASVRALDAVCNARIASAETTAALDAELRRKLYLKRLLVALPPARLEDFALAQLTVLERDGASV